MLANLCVYRVERIVLSSVIMDGESKILGKEADGRALLDDNSPEGLRIYLQRSDLSKVGMPTVLVRKMEEFLGLSQESRNVFQDVMMESDEETIRDILERQGIEQLAQNLQNPDPDANAAIEDDDDYHSDSSSNTSSPGKPGEKRISVSGPGLDDDHRIDYNRGYSEPMMGSSSGRKLAIRNVLALPSPGESPTPSRRSDNQRRSSTPGMSAAAPLGNGLSVFDLFQMANVEDTTPLVKRKSFSRSPELSASQSQSHLQGWNSLDSTMASNAMLSPSSTPTKYSRALSTHLRIPVHAINQHQRRRSGTSVSGEDDVDMTPWEREVGFHGELFVFKHLQKLLGNSFSFKNWTSRNRNRAFADAQMRQTAPDYADFVGKEKDHADFEFRDDTGALGEYLSQRGRRLPRWNGAPTLYHLEVKSAEGPLQTPFFMSNNQMDMARRYTISGPCREVYVIIRVYDLDTKDQKAARLHDFVDPWSLVFGGSLSLQTRDSFCLQPM
jgi:hypothetical protein